MALSLLRSSFLLLFLGFYFSLNDLDGTLELARLLDRETSPNVTLVVAAVDEQSGESDNVSFKILTFFDIYT